MAASLAPVTIPRVPEDVPSPEIAGVVEDGEGRPLAGAWVALGGSPEGLAVSADGSFTLPAPAPGDDLAVRVLGRQIRVALVGTAGRRLRVVFAPPDSVPMRVLTPGSAAVPTHFGWTAFRRVPGGAAGLLETGSGEASAPRFLVRGLSPGTYGFVVWAGAFLPAVVEDVTLDGTRSHPLVTIELTRRGAAVAGRVLSADGAARVGVQVVAKREDERLRVPARRLSSRSDAGGRYRIEGLPAGRYALSVEGSPSETAVTLVEREERALDLSV